ncbi:uncharacterized protein LOC135226630 [Macrobrachium nipponense]|uniref:uncharacterized protein LOC135226630 n=1 Tax=Macrobrachium nipponense TaxID=159736 RepID=UPI0030C8558A
MQVGDFILLKDIICTPLEAIVDNEVVCFYELSIKNEDSIIRRLQKNDQAVKDIKRALEKRTDERELDSSEDSLLNMFERAYEKSANHRTVGTAVKKSPNRIHCQPLSPPRSRRKSTPGSPRITPSSPRILPREEKSPESLREVAEFSSPKLPSVTDSLDNVMKNINYIFDSEKSGLSPPHAEAMPVTSTQVCSPATGQLNSPRADVTVKPSLKGNISPIVAPTSGSNVIVQLDNDINPQPGCSKLVFLRQW